MKEGGLSATALGVAMRRAAHQVLDDPRVFDDPIALRIAAPPRDPAPPPDPAWAEQAPLPRGLRAFLAARCRYAEDELRAAVGRGARQYVVLGAGLDTFAYRNPYPDDLLHVFEVDHPATQAWKRARLGEAGIAIPGTLTFAPVDLETATLGEGMRRSGFDSGERTFFSWLGVTPYLTEGAVTATLRFVASMPAGSGIVFDYALSPSLLTPAERLAHDILAARVARAGEPFRAFFDPASLGRTLRAVGFGRVEDLGHAEINARYFDGRADNLRVGALARIVNARVSSGTATR